MHFSSLDEILAYAIQKEEEAAAFYQALAHSAENSQMKEVFESFTREELKHKTKLLSMDRGKFIGADPYPVPNLKIADYLVDIPLGATYDYQEALIVAMKREKQAYHLYTDLANATTHPEMRALFLSLAHEEANHKLRLELEYDQYILTEN